MQRMLGIAIAAIVVGTGVMAMPGIKVANAYSDYDAMDCGELWYARNSIYAQQGYCFKTAKARAVFGKACFPPYGELTAWQQKQVNLIIASERAQGCKSGY